MALDTSEILDGSVKILMLGLKVSQTVKSFPAGTDESDIVVAVVKAHIDEAQSLYKQIKTDVQD